MTPEQLIRTMRGRVPFDIARKILEAHEIERGMGWDSTQHRFLQNDFDEEVLESLGEALKQHILCGEKSIRFYRLNRASMEALRNSVGQVTVSNSRFQRAYPAQLDDSEIDGRIRPPTLAAIEQNDDGVGLVFASTRAFHKREHIDPSTLGDDAASALENYDEVIGISLQKYQAMDVVWIPHRGNYAEIRIDYPKGMHADTLEAAHNSTKLLFENVLDRDALPNPVNLFPLIQKIYDAANEGHVVELGFGTTTGSLKHEKMRRGRLCLRRETYHRGGKNALTTPIEPYNLSVRWRVTLGEIISHPELSLHGNARIAASANPTIHEMTVRGCVGAADYDHVRDRVEHFLRQP
ncbi:hypothetical protein [Bradyrhizobium sp. WSM1417]|uniref:hypothetical protein n=1 Tax=Bradyrhizobium sp. WSM1417 TaxID=754500 RepID=UPI00055B3763|nr:hypothetical protein [Bradyrhizobium sp. WSM1417]